MRNSFRAGALAVAGLLAFAACSDDWDDHYDTAAKVDFSGTTLDYLKSESAVSDFVDILTATGYDTELSAAQVLTIFAPENDTFNKDSLLHLVSLGRTEDVIDRFVENHIARYNVSINTDSQSVTLINSKVIELGTLSNPTVGNATADKTNVTCKNGVIQVINDYIPYKANLFEQLDIENESYLDATGGNDSVVTLFNFLHRYDDDELDEDRSVARGYDENGNVVYVDSVMIRRNTVLSALDAYLFREDSNYWAILPTTEAYQERVALNSQFFKYNVSYNSDKAVRDSVQNYMANLYAISDLFFNMNDNQHVEDSIFSTRYSRSDWEYNVFYHPLSGDGILTNVTGSVECSNGTLYKVDEYPFTIYDSFYRKIKLEGERSSAIADDGNNSWTNPSTTGWTLRSNSDADSISGGSYLYIYPTTSSRQTDIAYEIPSTLSGSYDIYVKLLPQSVYYTDSATIAASLPCQFRANIFERDTIQGTMPTRATYSFRNPEDNSRNYQNDPFRVDSVYLGNYTFSNCYLGTSAGVMLQLESYVTSSNRNKYTKEMYLDCIILIPTRDEANGEDTAETNDDASNE